MYPIIDIFGRKIGTYALISILGFIITCFFASDRAKKSGIKAEDMVPYYIISAFGVVIGGHLLYGLVNMKLTISAFSVMLQNITLKKAAETFIKAFGGSVFYGGLFGSAIMLNIALRNKEKEKKETIFGIYSLSVPLFHAFGRIGCFFGGCCYGIESKIGFTVLNNRFSPEMCGVNRFPVALLESAVNIFIFILLLAVFNSQKNKSHVFYCYGIMYSAARFFIEFLRGDEARGSFLCFSTSQWISIAFLIYCFISLIIVARNETESLMQ